MRANIITALDIGSSFVRVLIAQINSDGSLEIKGMSEVPSEGMDKGLVKDIQAVSVCVKSALQNAEEASGFKAENIYLNITGEHIRSQSVMGRISISGSLSNSPSEITEEHITQVINDAKNSIKIQKGFERMQILHGLPQYFDIDDQKEIYNPVNMTGYHLTAHVLLILADITSIRNLLKCVEVAGYHVESNNIVLSHIASALATLSDDEKRLGSILIDAGGGCCDIAFFNKGNLIQTAVTPVAGNNITRDLAIGLRTTLSQAELIKLEYGSAVSAPEEENKEITVEGISGRSSSKYRLSHVSMIIQSRLTEFMEACYQFIKNAYPPELITAGVVLTGGTAKLKNIDNFVADLFNLPVKIGYPDLSRLSGAISRLEDPAYATAIGLIYYAADQKREGRQSALPKVKLTKDNIFKKIIAFIKEYT
ncbi:MAG TPA: cell division protein FtsA [Candidatus Cloacimonadota bacterium]|nr:cell division protein FtsA [Candidatus Cloacimonadota bacterium]